MKIGIRIPLSTQGGSYSPRESTTTNARFHSFPRDSSNSFVCDVRRSKTTSAKPTIFYIIIAALFALTKTRTNTSVTARHHVMRHTVVAVDAPSGEP